MERICKQVKYISNTNDQVCYSESERKEEAKKRLEKRENTNDQVDRDRL